MARSGFKTRQPRLRLSCDGCFHAKVKCSRGPMCARCAANGIICRYSVSSRAGKPKTTDAGGGGGGGGRPSTTTTIGGAPPYELSGGPGTGGAGTKAAMPRKMSDSDPFGMAVSEVSSMLWPSAIDITGAGLGGFEMTSPWMAGQGYDFASMDHTIAYMSTPSSQTLSASEPVYLGSPSIPSDSSLHESLHHSLPSPSARGPCACFADCLESLHALHGASAPSPFDVVLSLNKKAVQGCAAMLACAACMGRPGTHTTAMLLATMIGKITTSYRHASRAHFNATSPAATAAWGLSVSLGTYTLGEADGRWLELELLARELRQLEQLHARFREVCADMTDDAEVCRVVVGYLENSLCTALEVVNHQKGVRAALEYGT